MTERLELRAIKDLNHRDEKYRARVHQLCSTVVYCTDDLKVPIPSRRSMNVPFDPDCDDHWIIRPDLSNLWYDRACYDLDPHTDDFLRDEKWTVMDSNYSTSDWSLSVTHWPYDKRRFRSICSLSCSVRPSLSIDRWRNRVDEDCFIITRIPFLFRFA